MGQSAYELCKTGCEDYFKKRVGLEIRKFSPRSSPVAQIVSSLKHFDIDLVFDVGANHGQFAQEIRSGGYTGRIVSFEPLSTAHLELLRTSSGDRSWDIYPRCALGDSDGEIEINVAGNSVSSSIMPMLESHRSAAPQSAYRGKETVAVKTLDALARPYLDSSRAPFLKIDTQGFEWQVLEGARTALPHIRGVLLELSLVPLYEGQHLWEEIIDRLKREGFNLWAIQPEFIDPRDGRTLQANGIFFRE